MANEPLKGKRFVKITEQKTKRDWSLFIKHISDQWYPKAKKITLVMDNFITHNAGALYEVFEPVEAKGYGTGLSLYIHPSMVVG
jgi:hypothetical protein